MKRLLPFVVLLLFLVACAQEELPPNPPAPGEAGAAGKAYGGLLISPGQLPKWAAALQHTDIEPIFVKSGDTVKVVVQKPSSVTTKFYAHAIAYAWNKKYKLWEKVFADTSQSGKIVKQWAEDRGVFFVPISAERFTAGPNYVVIYWCIDTEKRDSQGFKVWDCNGRKWGLGAFEMSGALYPDILIERDIENNRYKLSSKELKSDGTVYTADYEDLNKVKTSVSVTMLTNVENWKKQMALMSGLDQKWSKIGNVCGFVESGTGYTQFTWLSGVSTGLTVKTFASTVDAAKIGVYGIKYPSDCDLLSKLKLLAPVAGCGNNKVDINEVCDGSDDIACPKNCKPDCTCATVGDPNFGFCGDNIIQKPNKDGITEDCEPPGKVDPVTGQLISSACFLRNVLGVITGTGACDNKCKCIQTPFTKSACGNGVGDPGEQCGDPGTPGCGIGQMCVGCSCWQIPQTCGNGVKDAGEQCDPGQPGVACPVGQLCTGNCLCVNNPGGKCGDGKVTPPEQCEKAADCPQGLPGTFKACLACGCAYFGWPGGGCGDKFVDKNAGEECEKDDDCANPPGGTASPRCNLNTCKCYRVCGDAKIDSPNDEVPPKNEECDPPGKPGVCPPMKLPGGGCAIPLCGNDCKCPGEKCAGCGDGIVDKAAGEECEKPGDWCGCAIGADGAISCLICSNACKCGPTSAVSPCKPAGGKDCPPVSGITMGANTGYDGKSGMFFTLGIQYPTFDQLHVMMADGSDSKSQCGQVCVQEVIAKNAVDTDGEDVTKDGRCYYVSGIASSTSTFTTSKIFSESSSTTSRTYTITGIKSRCKDADEIYEPTVEGTKCIEELLRCPLSMECREAVSGAACLPKTATGPGPTAPTYVWTEGICNYGGCPPMCTGEVAGWPCYTLDASCTLIPATYSSYGKTLICRPGTPTSGGGTGGTSGPTEVPTTSGCTASMTTSGCYSYYTGTSTGYACSGTYGGCSVTYGCSSSGKLTEYRSPPGCTSDYTTGSAIVMTDVADVVQSKGMQVALLIIAAAGIFLITLLNFTHKE